MVLGSRFLRTEETPNLEPTSEHVAGFNCVPFSKLRGQLTKKVEEEDRDNRGKG